MVYPIGYGTIEILDAQTKRKMGYVFVEEASKDGALEEQRWVLYDGFCPPPAGVMLLRAPESPALRMRSRAEWEKALREGDLWRRDARYVKVNAVAYTEIVAVPSFPDRMLDEGVSKVVRDDRQQGMLYTTTSASGDASVEHWILNEGFVAAPEATLLVGGASAHPGSSTLREFLAQAKLEWRAGATYVVSACSSFSSLPDTL